MIDIREHGGNFGGGGNQNTKRLIFPELSSRQPIQEDVKNERLFMLGKSSASNLHTVRLLEYDKDKNIISENQNYVGGNTKYTARLSTNTSMNVTIRNERSSYITSFTVNKSVLNDTQMNNNTPQIQQVVYIPSDVPSKRLYLVLLKIYDGMNAYGGKGYIMVYDDLGSYVTSLNPTLESITYMTISPLGKLLVYYTSNEIRTYPARTIYQLRQVKSDLTLDAGVEVGGADFESFGMAALSNMTEYYLRDHRDNILD